MPLQRVKAETTSTEFVDWLQYLEQDWNRPRREDWYLAQVAAEVRRSRVMEPGKVKTKELLIEFESGERTDDGNKPTEEQLATRTARSKAAWFTRVGQPQAPPTGAQ